MQQQPNYIDHTMVEQKENFFTETKESVKQYINDRILLIKLQAIKKVSSLGGSIVSAVLMLIVGLFLLVFVSITLGFFLSSLLHNYTAGFGIVAGIYLILFIIILTAGKKIVGNKITESIIQNSFKKKDGKQ